MNVQSTSALPAPLSGTNSAGGDIASVSPSAAPVGVASDTPGTQPRTSLPTADATAAIKVSAAVAETDAAGEIVLEGSPFGGAAGARIGVSGPNAAGAAVGGHGQRPADNGQERTEQYCCVW